MTVDKHKVLQARVRKGLLLRELAELAGVSFGSTRKACGCGVAGIKVARALAKALDVKLADIVILPEDSPTGAAG